jgi:eukaryotic-like serine/threonine-protein kinase
VIRRCLEPDPVDRYPDANELASDLQAVADDAALRWTREPLHVRAVRRVRRSWKRAVLVAVVAGSAVGLAMAALREGDDRARDASTASSLLEEGRQALREDDFATALARFDGVFRLTRGRKELVDLHHQAVVAHGQARLKAEVRDRADTVSKAADSARFHLIGSEGRPEEAGAKLEALLAPFRVLDDPDWARSPALLELDPARKARLFRDVDELMYLFASRFDAKDRVGSRRGIAICDRAKAFADPRTWQALRNWLDESPIESIPGDPQAEPSARSSFEWGVLLARQGRPAAAIGWLDRAAYLEPDNAWYQYHLATIQANSGDARASMPHYEAAIALEPSNRRFRLDRARALRSIGEWARAEEDERRAGGSEWRP